MRKNGSRPSEHKSTLSGIRQRKSSVQGQILYSCTVLLLTVALSSIILGTVFYKTFQGYNLSMQTFSDIYYLDNALENWEAAAEEYIFSETDISRQNCKEHWTHIGELLNQLHIDSSESSVLTLTNIRTLYAHCKNDIDNILQSGQRSARLAGYAALSERKADMVFLTNQLLKAHMEQTIKDYPQTVSYILDGFAIFALLLIVSLLLFTACSARMVQMICVPIDALVSDAREMAAGSYDTPAIEIIHDDELGYLTKVFNEMKTEVSANFKNMERIIELQDLLQTTQLQALQAQINPHFLFNVLSIAEEAALIENANQTIEVIESISYMLRYSLKCTQQDIFLHEEVHMAKIYMSLQGKRFGDRIQFVISIPDTIPPLLVPGFSLQPIIENAIYHGIGKKENGGIVSIRIKKHPEYIEISISDNGDGIAPELLKRIFCKESSFSHGHGIGLSNVIRRLEIFYGRKNLLRINSSIHQGTTVTIQYPLQEGGRFYV